jgi:hypothetical protein
MRTLLRTLVLVAPVALSVASSLPALGAPPGNDGIDGAIRVASVPFVHEQDTADATASGPRACGNNSSVFFRFEPRDGGRYQVDTLGSEYDTVLTVFTGRGRSIDVLGCNDDRFNLASGVRFRAREGTTYYLMVSTCCGSGLDRIGGPLVLAVDRVDPEPLVAAISISAGSSDQLTGDVTVSGTKGCSKRSVLYIEAVVRQVRNGVLLARAYVSVGVPCVPGDDTWSTVVEPQTGVIFGPGQAFVRYYARFAFDGFRDQIQLPSGEGTILIT